MAQATKIIGTRGIGKLITKLPCYEPGWPIEKGSIILLNKIKMFDSKLRNEGLPNTFFTHRKGNIHRERDFLKELTGKIQCRKLQVEKIKAQNYSTYSKCADALLIIKDARRDGDIGFSLKIEFANIYRLWEKWNRNSLKMLVKNGVALGSIQGEDDWKAFLNDERFVELTDREKPKLLESAELSARMNNERQGIKIFNHIGVGNTFLLLGKMKAIDF